MVFGRTVAVVNISGWQVDLPVETPLIYRAKNALRKMKQKRHEKPWSKHPWFAKHGEKAHHGSANKALEATPEQLG